MRVLNRWSSVRRGEKRGSKSEVAGRGHSAIAHIIVARRGIPGEIGALHHAHFWASRGAGRRARHGPDRRSDQHENHEQGDAAQGFHAPSRAPKQHKFKDKCLRRMRRPLFMPRSWLFHDDLAHHAGFKVAG